MLLYKIKKKILGLCIATTVASEVVFSHNDNGNCA